MASPFVTFGERAEEYLAAVRSGDPAEIKAKINAAFGELYAPGGGDAPAWTEVAKLKAPYRYGDLPTGVVLITCGVDVQKNRLVFVVRGWGARATSWLLDCDEFWGATEDDGVWNQLSNVMENNRYGGLPIRRTIIDSGYRPDKPERGPEHKVYEFCRRHQRLCMPAKGAASLSGKPLVVSPIEVTPKGGGAKYSIQLVRVNTDWAKLWLHERIRWPHETSTGEINPGAFFISQDTHDAYCMSMCSEARIAKPSGRALWVPRSRENHFWDCEALAYIGGTMLAVQRIPEGYKVPLPPQPKAAPPPQRRDGDGWLKSDSWLGSNSDWFGR